MVYGSSTISSNLIVAKWADNITGFVQIQSIPLTPGYMLRGVALIDKGNYLYYWCPNLAPRAFYWDGATYQQNLTKFTGFSFSSSLNYLVFTDSILLNV